MQAKAILVVNPDELELGDETGNSVMAIEKLHPFCFKLKDLRKSWVAYNEETNKRERIVLDFGELDMVEVKYEQTLWDKIVTHFKE